MALDNDNVFVVFGCGITSHPPHHSAAATMESCGRFILAAETRTAATAVANT